MNNKEEKREYKNVWEYRVKEYFRKKEKQHQNNSSTILWEIVNLVLYESTKDRLLVDLYNVLDKENFVKVISLLDGRTFKCPTKKELEETLLLALLYYEREVEHKSWGEIQKTFDFPVSSIKYGIRIKNLNNWIKQKIQELIRAQVGESNG